jgi:hypothetical protein
MRNYTLLSVFAVIGLLADRDAIACEPYGVDAVEVVFVDVGMWDAAVNGFSYDHAAYEELGEALDSRDHLEDATNIYVTFTYTATLFGVSGTHIVPVCLSRSADQTWEQAALALLNPSDDGNSDESSSGAGNSGGSGGYGYMPEWFDPTIPAPPGCFDIYNCQGPSSTFTGPL